MQYLSINMIFYGINFTCKTYEVLSNIEKSLNLTQYKFISQSWSKYISIQKFLFDILPFFLVEIQTYLKNIIFYGSMWNKTNI